mmetsp:Transcript_3377/g.21067  ORF Transcript_3377/g.21067 Transcript_3377/m.21067 type:complete len:235 (+) Transcript_3377:1541-2245(+)
MLHKEVRGQFFPSLCPPCFRTSSKEVREHDHPSYDVLWPVELEAWAFHLYTTPSWIADGTNNKTKRTFHETWPFLNGCTTLILVRRIASFQVGVLSYHTIPRHLVHTHSVHIQYVPSPILQLHRLMCCAALFFLLLHRKKCESYGIREEMMIDLRQFRYVDTAGFASNPPCDPNMVLRPSDRIQTDTTTPSTSIETFDRKYALLHLIGKEFKPTDEAIAMVSLPGYRLRERLAT